MRVIFYIVFLLLLLSTPSIYAAARFVSPAGDDTNDGASWSTPWETLTNVNDSTKFTHGDTAIFGTGVWREVLQAISGASNSDRTCYIDSLHYEGVYGTGRVAWVYGSDAITEWSQIGASNVYIATFTPSNLENQTAIWQGDTVLFRREDSSAVNEAGEWWYGNGHVIAWVRGGDDPDNYTIENSQRAGVYMTKTNTYGGGQDNVSIIGLGFKYFRTHAIQDHDTGIQQQGWDSCLFSHLYLDNAAGWLGVNPSLIFTGASDTGNEDPIGSGNLDAADYNYITACSLGTVVAFANDSIGSDADINQEETTINAECINFYSWRYSVIDSCTFFGTQSENNIYFKIYQGGNPVVGPCGYDTIRFNQFTGVAPQGLKLWGGSFKVVVYGNIFKGQRNAISISHSQLLADSVGHHEIYNNTLIDSRMVHSGPTYDYPHIKNKFKYNVMYRSNDGGPYDGEIWDQDSASYWIDIDSNMYYAELGTNEWNTYTLSGLQSGWAAWLLVGFDANSSNTTDPGFTDAANGNFSRLAAANELNRTYGAYLFTINGATQNPIGLLQLHMKNGVYTGGVYR